MKSFEKRFVSYNVELAYRIYDPESDYRGKNMLLFGGGGWRSMSIEQLSCFADEFVKCGVRCFIPEYRVSSKHDTTAKDSFDDCCNFWEYLSDQKTFRSDEQIFLCGASAGGTLALLLSKYLGNRGVKVQNIFLFNPVVDLFTLRGFEKELNFAERKQFSPMECYEQKCDMEIFHGDCDTLVPISDIYKFQKKLQSKGINCHVNVFEGKTHGFFNKQRDKETFEEICKEICKKL